MKVHFGLDDIPSLKNAVVTSGTFDGVHLGHQKILSRLIDLASETNGESVVISFWPHPRFVLSAKKPDLKLLSTIKEKIDLLEKTGIDHFVIIPFTKEFSLLSSEQFIQDILINKIQTKNLVIGYDHRFGRNREGGFDYLVANQHKFPFQIEEIPEQDIDDLEISSTLIRKALQEGNVAKAQKLLGHSYSLRGNVALGDQLGRKINFPTANIAIEQEEKLIPDDGVYAVKIKVGKQLLNGMLNIGFRPTVNGVQRTVETHIFNFEEDIYTQEIEVFFYDRIRKEKKFIDIHALKNQLVEDKKEAERILAER